MIYIYQLCQKGSKIQNNNNGMMDDTTFFVFSCSRVSFGQRKDHGTVEICGWWFAYAPFSLAIAHGKSKATVNVQCRIRPVRNPPIVGCRSCEDAVGLVKAFHGAGQNSLPGLLISTTDLFLFPVYSSRLLKNRRVSLRICHQILYRHYRYNHRGIL